jgi:hypothetical protein
MKKSHFSNPKSSKILNKNLIYLPTRIENIFLVGEREKKALDLDKKKTFLERKVFWGTET